MSVFLGLGSVELLQALLAQILAQRVLHVLFREEDVDTLELGIVGSHTIVLQARDGLHALLRHILLGQCDGHLLSTVVAEVDEDYHVTLLDATVDRGIVDRLDELVGHAVIVALLHGLYHIGSLLAHAVDDQVVAFLHALPALVAVHGVETAHD